MERLAKGKKHLLLLGIGGSALGPRALQKAFMPQQDWPGHAGPWLWIADNVDASALEAWLEKLPPKETLVLVVSKSGGTIETMAQYFIVREWLQKELGAAWTGSVLAVTDEKSGALRQEVDEKGLSALPVPDHLGGRFSVLSAVGMVPAWFCGMDWKGILTGAAAVLNPLGERPELAAAHPAWRLALWARTLMDFNYSQLIFFSYIPSWACFGAWFAQLWGESLGKAGRGSMPLPATGVTDQHSLLQMFLDGPKDKGCLFLEGLNLPRGPRFSEAVPDKWSYLRGQSFGDVLDAETIGTLGAFAASDVPLVRLSMGEQNEHSAGALMALLELATLFTGWLLEINPLDQPAVEYGKRLANARLGASGYTKEKQDLNDYFAVAGGAKELQEF
jgi:glucose-6-phosphate isomerase